ncbi:MAG: DUF2161 family putative PD-(D/E)XK-type phosphodiesterase [Defluviitaleaceae bacterium]|nr:DUF2161 family putative PD-(D/E)XK-type phosphodiesterase [Defluviitaleaceae bacterium]
MKKYSESDLYDPIKTLLISQGFIVRGEVKGCDIAAVRGEDENSELWVVEMKLSANITLIYQAMERQTATPHIFIAIPRPRRANEKTFRALKKLLKKLEIGLITVALDSPVKHAEIISFPESTKRSRKETKRAAIIKKEISGRTVDSPGGTTKTIINTAYRERCIKIACLIEKNGPLSAKSLKEMGCESDTYNILRSNNYNWFEKIAKGIYNITEICKDYLENNKNTALIKHYSKDSL